MPRINIEDDVESRGEFWRLFKLTGDRDAALGKLVRFFRLAQKKFGHGEVITKTELENEELTCMIESGWAVPERDGYQTLGAKKQFAWYTQRVEAGKKGGRPPKPPESDNRDEPAVNRPVITDNRDEPAVNPLTLSLSLSPSLKNKEKTFDFESLYSRYPEKKGKKRGIERCRKQIKTLSQYEALKQAIERYAAYYARALERDEFRPYAAHFSTFMAADYWPDWLDPEMGLSPSHKEQVANAATGPPSKEPEPELEVSLEQMEKDVRQMEAEGQKYVAYFRRRLEERRLREGVS